MNADELRALKEFRGELSRLLADLRCGMNEEDIRLATKECRNDLRADAERFGQSLDASMFNLLMVGGVAVFTFFESPFSVFIVKCDEFSILDETNDLALSDVEACKQLLAKSYGKQAPDLVLERSLAKIWLS